MNIYALQGQTHTISGPYTIPGPRVIRSLNEHVIAICCKTFSDRRRQNFSLLVQPFARPRRVCNCCKLRSVHQSMKRRKEPERYSTGSLIARIGFQPIEETLRVFFSRTLSMSSSASSEKPKEDELSTASRTLVSLLSLQVSLSLFLVTFIPPYLPIALRVLLPPRYLDTSAPAVLGAWVYYIPFLAINGGLEAFVSSVAKPSDLARQSR